MSSQSDAYPSDAARYGSDTLMTIAGTLAESAEKELTDLTMSLDNRGHPLTRVIAQALIANAFATLAHTAAVRERTDIVADVLAEPQAD